MKAVNKFIANYRYQLEAFGFLRQVRAPQQSDGIRQMRPSLRKVAKALAEDPDLLRRNVQPAPMSVLFEYTLPRIEHVLIEVGEQRGTEIVYALVEHGVKMIAKHTLEGAREHLEELFRDLTEYEGRLKEEGGMQEIIEAYRKLDFGGRGEEYLRLKLGDKIREMEINAKGMIELKMKRETTDVDLLYLRKVLNLQELNLWETQMNDAGLRHLEGLKNLQVLRLNGTLVSDAGLRHLEGLKNLQVLRLNGTLVSDAGLRHLEGLKNLQELGLSGTQVSDEGLKHLKGLKNLRELDFGYTQVSYAGIEKLKRTIPGLKIWR